MLYRSMNSVENWALKKIWREKNEKSLRKLVRWFCTIFSRGTLLLCYSTHERDRSVFAKTRTIRLPLFFGRNSRVISGPAISPPRLLCFDYKFRNEISYSLRDPFIRHSNGVFLRSRVVPPRKHVNTYGVSARATHRPFHLTMCTSRFLILHAPPAVGASSSFLILPLPSSSSCHWAKIRAFTTSSFTRGFWKYFNPPAQGAASRFLSTPRPEKPTWSRRDNRRLARFYATSKRRGATPSNTMLFIDLRPSLAFVLGHLSWKCHWDQQSQGKFLIFKICFREMSSVVICNFKLRTKANLHWTALQFSDLILIRCG